MGTKSKFVSVAVRIPPPVGTAMGFMTSEPAPVENITAMRARIVVAVVITIGRIRKRAASAMTSLSDRSALSLFDYCSRYSTMTMPASNAIINQ